MSKDSFSQAEYIAERVVEATEAQDISELTPRKVAEVVVEAESQTERLSFVNKPEVYEQIGSMASDSMLSEAPNVLRRKRIVDNARLLAQYAMTTRRSA